MNTQSLRTEWQRCSANSRQAERFARRLLAAFGVLALAGQSLPAQVTERSETTSFSTITLAHPAEDLIRLPSTDWVIAGNIIFAAGLHTAGGGLYWINIRTRQALPVNLHQVLVGQPDPEFRACPGPPAADDFSAHGIDFTVPRNGNPSLLVVNHGGRESIEVFRVSTKGEMPTLRWAGCVVFPSHLILNAVAPMNDGGFVATSMLDRNDKDAFNKMVSGDVTGVVYRWKPGSAPFPLKGTEASVDNGIEVGPDGSIYVAAWGSKEVLRFRRTGQTFARESTPVDFLPDNLRWAPDGSLLVAGQRRDRTKMGGRCNGGPCPVAWAAARLDPKTMRANTFMSGDGISFSEATTALQIGDEIWLGSASDHNIAIFRNPAQLAGTIH